MIKGIKFVTVPVRDQDRALAFYTERLGFMVATDQPFNDSQRWIELKLKGVDTRVVLFTLAGVYSDFTLLIMAAALAPAMVLGTWLGHSITMKLSREQFLRMLYALMIASGSSLIIRALAA